jgi:SWIM zinc finger
MKQVYINKATRKNVQPRRTRSTQGTRRLWHRVVLKPSENECWCTCEYFKYNPGLVCKHILRIVEMENGLAV